MKEFIQGPWFSVAFGSIALVLLSTGFFLRPKRKPLPPSDLERVEFLRRGTDDQVWRFSLEGPDAKLWDECLRQNLHATKGFKELNWKKELV